MPVPCVIRVPLVPGVTDTDENIRAIAAAARRLPAETFGAWERRERIHPAHDDSQHDDDQRFFHTTPPLW
jgi:pyruvate-formate lyase-activating enzyme